MPLPSRLGGLGSVVSAPNGVWSGVPAASDLGAFTVQFYAILRISEHYEGCLKMAGDSYPLPASRSARAWYISCPVGCGALKVNIRIV